MFGSWYICILVQCVACVSPDVWTQTGLPDSIAFSQLSGHPSHIGEDGPDAYPKKPNTHTQSSFPHPNSTPTLRGQKNEVLPDDSIAYSTAMADSLTHSRLIKFNSQPGRPPDRIKMEREDPVSNFVMSDAETRSEVFESYTHSAEEGKTGTQPRNLEVEIVSSRRTLTVTTNGRVILSSATGNNLTAEDSSSSITFLVLSQHTGRLLCTATFRTTVHTESMRVHPFLESIADGRILIAGVKTEASLNLPFNTRAFLARFGFSSFRFFNFRNYFAGVAITGGKTLAEAIAIDDTAIEEGVFGSPIAFHVTVPLMPSESCSWLRNQSKRSSFCSTYDGYGDICDCSVDSPSLIDWVPKTLPNSPLTKTPLVIIAGNRPSALYRCLATVLSQPGGSKSLLLVSIDGHHPEVLALLDLLEIRAEINLDPPLYSNSTSMRISKHYIFSLEETFRAFPNAPNAIVLEEDLLVSPDFFSFFSQTAWLLEADPTLYCISAWNDLGAMHSSRDRSKLLRIETHPGYGWMFMRSFFEEVKQEWKDITNDHDWDVWFRSPHLRAGRECVIPAVSRTFHYGLSGAHVNGVLTLAHFTGHLASAGHEVELDTEGMLQEAYERRLYAVLQDERTVFMNSTLHPCNFHYLPKNFTEAALVVAFDMMSAEDYTGWSRLGGCNGFWQLDSRGHHRGLFQFEYYNTTLYAIGTPFSDYSWLVPPGVHVIRSYTSLEEKKDIDKLVLYNRIRFRVSDLEPFAPLILREKLVPKPIFVAHQVQKN